MKKTKLDNGGVTPRNRNSVSMTKRANSVVRRLLIVIYKLSVVKIVELTLPVEYYELNVNQDNVHGVVKPSPIVKIAKYLPVVRSDVPTTSVTQRGAGLGRRTAIGLVESTRCLRAMSGLTCLEKVFFLNTASSWKKNLAESCSKLKTSITSTVSETITALKTLNYGQDLSQEVFVSLKKTTALLAPAHRLTPNERS